MVGHNARNPLLCRPRGLPILWIALSKGPAGMKIPKLRGSWLGAALVVSLGGMLAFSSVAAVKNLAVVVSAGSKLQDVPLAELAKLCKGAQKSWADGRSFTLVLKDPSSAQMHVAVEKLFGTGDVKATIAKLNESRQVVKIVDTDEELLRVVGATPGAAGILDVYSINSSVKVLRVDGKLPFDAGYVFKGN